jgi:hypothetical protein
MELGNRRICTAISGAYSENRLPLDHSEGT